jgi:antitoxin component YwqK of YwqJK toxin-antitoxin module
MEQKKELNFINLYNVNGNRHGYWEYYYDNGNLSYKGNYVDDIKHGYWEYYWSNGNLFYKVNYVDDIKHGYWEYYWSNGNLMYKGTYVDGKQHGYWEEYWSNGNLMYKGNYVDGNKHGYWERYHENGKLFYKCFYDMGERVDYNPDELKQTELTLDEIIFPCILEVSQSKDFTESSSMMPNKKQVCICKLGDKYVCIESPEEQNDYILETINKGIKYGGGGGMMLIFWNYARKINNQK